MPRGGKRKNAGAPKRVQRRTLKSQWLLPARSLRERTMAHADNLFNALLTNVVGSVSRTGDYFNLN